VKGTRKATVLRTGGYRCQCTARKHAAAISPVALAAVKPAQIVALNAAIRLAPGDASLFDLRALAHALSVSATAAEREWARAAELDPGSIAPTISRGWLALRHDRASEAAAHSLSRPARPPNFFWTPAQRI
jgi:hypothetical protein